MLTRLLFLEQQLCSGQSSVPNYRWLWKLPHMLQWLHPSIRYLRNYVCVLELRQLFQWLMRKMFQRILYGKWCLHHGVSLMQYIQLNQWALHLLLSWIYIGVGAVHSSPSDDCKPQLQEFFEWSLLLVLCKVL